ncbi:MAG TPA: TonB family protein, partial [Gammaproteobacteria bacterium]|nr:TonB family protein [Gammaproteobacteria bacterium]
LHTAIEQAQQYPASAQEQQREGRVTLAFTLAPNGSISHSRVAASSGISSLDHAALQALHAAAPFQHINKYLHSVENYQIDVIFKLN